jgi:hypothetical protein
MTAAHQNARAGVSLIQTWANGKENDVAKSNKEGKTNWVKQAFLKWAVKASKKDCDPLKIKDAPEWVFNAHLECAKIVFPSGLPSAEKWNAEFLGEFLGRYEGLARLFAGEVPLGSETQSDVQKLEAMISGLPTPKNLKAIQKDAETVFNVTQEMIPIATALAGNSSYNDTLYFQKGLLRGIEIKPEELATSRTFRRHTRKFWVLALFWRYWVKCKSVREVYDHLCKMVGEKKIGSFKTFETHVAKKLD